MEVKEVKKLKINAESIRSTLFESNKKLIKLRKDENSLLKKREDTEKKKKKEVFLESIKKGFSNLKPKKQKKTAGGSMLDNIMAFFGLIGGALFAKALPGLIAGVERFINWAKGVFEAIKSFMNKIDTAITRFVQVYEASPFNVEEVDKNKEELEKKVDELKQSVDGADAISSKLKGQVEDKTNELEESKKKQEEMRSNAGNLTDETSALIRQELAPVENLSVQERVEGDGGSSSIIPSNINLNNVADSEKFFNKIINQQVEEFDRGGLVDGLKTSLSSGGGAIEQFEAFKNNLISQRGIIESQEGTNNALLDIIDNLQSMFGKRNQTLPMSNEDSYEKIKDMILSLLVAFEAISKELQTDFPVLSSEQKEDVRTLNSSSQLGQAASELKGLGTNREETNSGRDGCVWAVNQVYDKAGLTPPWGDSLWVPDAEKMMVKDGYTQVPYNERRSGDIMVMYDQQTPPQAHLGVVLPNGNVLSNSSSTASLSWEDTPEGYNRYYNGTGIIYRMPSSTGRKVNGNNVISNIPITPMKYDLASIQNISTDQFEETNTIVLKVNEVVPVIVGG